MERFPIAKRNGDILLKQKINLLFDNMLKEEMSAPTKDGIFLVHTLNPRESK